MSIDMSQFYQVFFDESAEHLAEMEHLLLEIDVANPDIEQLNAIFRAAHSIKGGSGTFGFSNMTSVTHELETLLDKLRKGEMAPHTEMIDAFLEATDVLKDQLNCHINSTDSDPALADAICKKLRQLTLGENAAPGTITTPENTEKEPPPQPAELPDTPPAAKQKGRKKKSTSEPALYAYAITIMLDDKDGTAQNTYDNIAQELERFGTLEVLAREILLDDSLSEKVKKPKKGKDGKKSKKAKQKNTTSLIRWQLQLTTASSESEIRDSLEFVIDPTQFTITLLDTTTDNIAVTANDAENTVDEGYGFFEPLPETTSGETDTNGGDEGYGFFEPLPTPKSEENEQGYGFFTEIPAPPVESRPESAEPATATASPVSIVTQEETPHRRATDRPGNAAASGTETSSIRVSVEKVDQLINLVGELVITQAMLAQTASTLDSILYESLQNGLTQLERNTRSLQESVMSIRMMPISFVFSRFPRVVRDLASKLGKQVELVTVGENTELDKGLIERIADPLTHLVRNSLDHGIETPEKRIAAGKPAKGTVTLSASHQGGAIVVEVSDDGAGLNREKILAKAVERGLQVSDSMSDQEVWQLIFAPGFSTADVVTDVSGRGVGMDVVQRNITEMGGNVEIESLTGFGTKITVRLPLTLAILDGMSVALGDSTYVIPLGMIVETFQPKPEDIKAVTGQGEVVHIRGEYLPLIALHKIFNMEPKYRDPSQGVLVMIEDKGKRAALLIDSLLGQQQVVIKSLENNYRKVSGVSGATIMGDGRVALILDVAALIKTGQSGF